MNGIKAYALAAIIIFGFLQLAPTASAATVRWNQKNFDKRPHPQVVSISFSDGIMSGELADGSHFKQFTVYEDGGLKIQKFVLEDYSHFVINGKIIYKLGNLAELIGSD